MGAALDSAKEVMRKQEAEGFEQEERRKKRERFEQIERERIVDVKRAMWIISNITKCPYDEKRNRITLGNIDLEPCVDNDSGYSIRLVNDRNLVDPGSLVNICGYHPTRRTHKKSEDPKDVIEYLASCAGHTYPDKAEQIDAALEDMDAHEESLKAKKKLKISKSKKPKFAPIQHVTEGENPSPKKDSRSVMRKIMYWLDQTI